MVLKMINKLYLEEFGRKIEEIRLLKAKTTVSENICDQTHMYLSAGCCIPSHHCHSMAHCIGMEEGHVKAITVKNGRQMHLGISHIEK